MHNLLETSGVITGIAGVYLAVKLMPLCWIVSAINVLIYFVLFWNEKLYADAFLQLIYCGISVYGWFHWTSQTSELSQTLIVTKASSKQMIVLGILFVIVAASLAIALQYFTDASYPIIDSSLTSASLAAQYLQTKKKIQNWIIWIFVDIGYVFLFSAKGLYGTSALYALFILLAWRGYISWKKD